MAPHYPPLKKFVCHSLFNHATPFQQGVQGREQVIGNVIFFGPCVCQDHWATQEEIFPKVVVGEER